MRVSYTDKRNNEALRAESHAKSRVTIMAASSHAGGRCLLISDVFPVAADGCLRRIAIAEMNCRARRLRGKLGAFARVDIIGDVPDFLLMDMEKKGIAIRQIQGEVDVEAMERSMEFVDELAKACSDGSAQLGLFCQGVSLVEVCRDPLLWLLSKAWIVRKTILKGLDLGTPDAVIFMKRGNLENIIWRSLADTKSVATYSPFPLFLEKMKVLFSRFFRLLYMLRKEARMGFHRAVVGSSRDGKDKADAGSSVCFYSAGWNAIRSILPVLAELSKKPGPVSIEIIFRDVHFPQVTRWLATAGLRLMEERRLRPARVRDMLNNIHSVDTFRRDLDDIGLRFADIPLSAILRNPPVEFGDLYVGVVRSWVEFWKNELYSHPYRLLVSGNVRDWRTRAVMMATSEYRADTIGVQDGFFAYNPRHACSKGCFLFVGGEETKRFMERLGVDGCRIHCFGVPKYDELVSSARKSRHDVCAELGLRENAHLVVLTTDHSVNLSAKKREAEALLRAVEEMTEIELILKLHPLEKDSVVHEAVREAKAKNPRFPSVHMIRDYNVLDLMAAADLVITRHSSTGIEAMALNRPVMVLNLTGEEDLIGYAKMGAARGVYRETDLKEVLQEMLSDFDIVEPLLAGGKRFVEENLGPLDGKAAERCADWIFKRLSAGDSLAI